MAKIGEVAQQQRSSAGVVGVVGNRVTPQVASIGRPVAGATFADSDFESTPIALRNQANAMVFGDGGTGKTTFATMYAPDPVAFINFDNRAHHAVAKARDAGRTIHYVHVPFPANVSKADVETARKVAQSALDMVTRNFDIAIEESLRGNCRSICIDTGTELAEILAIAIRGRPEIAKGDYGKSKDLINRELWRLLNRAREGNAHFILLARAKAIWENNEPTGKFTFRGPDVMNDGVDWAGHIRLKRGRAGRLKKQFELEVTKAGVNIEELGSVYTSAEWEDLGGPFIWASMLQYPGTTPEDWI